MEQAEIIIRDGLIFDGRGGAPFQGDVAIRGDKIVAVGSLRDWEAEREVDATGRIVTPGFVDIHTHYDGQVVWEERLVPSSHHGVTTVVIGNCGVGFAPCRETDRESLVHLMEGIEDIPEIVMTEGLPWDWESYPEYLDSIERRRHDLNIASLLPHSALRVFVMGERAGTAPATPEDCARMSELTREAMAAGAVGFGTSRTLFHRSSTGETAPTLMAEERELLAICNAMKECGGGVIEIATTYDDGKSVAREFEMFERLAVQSGQKVMLPTVQLHAQPDGWRDVLAHLDGANERGARIMGQVIPRGVGMILGLELSLHPFKLCPTFIAMEDLPPHELLTRLRDPEVADAIVNETPLPPPQPLMGQLRDFDKMFEMESVPDYEPALEDSIAARAARIGIRPEALAYDILTRKGRGNKIFMPFANYAYGTLDPVLEMLQHPHCVIGLGDGGAHCGIICDASYSTFMMTHWTRDRSHGGMLPLEEVVKQLSHDTAVSIGLEDRGVIAPGYQADINVIDYDALELQAPQITFDLPGGGKRLSQKANGYVATIINGQVVYQNGEPTNALPGRLVRGRQAVPA